MDEADYDGDVLSLRGIWSDEANAECEKLMNEKMTALNITGNNSKAVAKEVFNSLYEMTKDCPQGKTTKTVSVPDRELYLNTAPDDITLSFLANIFADKVDTTKSKTGTHKCRYNSWDTTFPACQDHPLDPHE